MEGLANERLAFYLAKAGRYHTAEPYLKRAIELYLDGWGSIAKSKWLQDVRAKALGVISFFESELTLGSGELCVSSDP